VTALLGKTIDLIRRDPTFSAIDMRIDGAGCLVRVDPAQMQLVFQNVLINAAQAMNGHGAIAVTTAPADGLCRIAIADAGPGMSAEVRDRAFEPFFTTKTRGTGLGLPLAKRIVDAHGGQIQIDTPSTGGTVVTLLVPTAR
jgi:two-component system sensor histidine kinase HydH